MLNLLSSHKVAAAITKHTHCVISKHEQARGQTFSRLPPLSLFIFIFNDSVDINKAQHIQARCFVPPVRSQSHPSEEAQENPRVSAWSSVPTEPSLVPSTAASPSHPFHGLKMGKKMCPKEMSKGL